MSDIERYLETQRPTDGEAERLLRRLRAESRERAAAPPREKPRWWLVPILVAALALAVIRIGPEVAGELQTRGISIGQRAPVVQLRMLRAASLSPATSGGSMDVGESVIFRVDADRDATLYVWVEGPGGREAIAQEPVSAGVPLDLRLDGGLLVYRFDASGRYRFYASTVADNCRSPSCMMKVVEVR